MKRMIHIDTRLGSIGIAEEDGHITDVFFSSETPPQALTEQTPLLKDAAAQIVDYLAGRRRSFDLPLLPCGTEFQKNVWNALLQIPYGQTKTYQEIAEAVGNPKACRAVGNANNKNPISILIPCHRVIGKNGSMVGYGGGLAIKEQLLALERTD
ncbi:MAG: cysteine methyltransferase [Firmicutes bacterium HGW-Firmicutes-11]|jgi:methylated-DNA-[protein]-cysteine S-methyltransferase|nr:MAG: cysteine methyltransferase [Firmicutes bacterium HGW-Firmicutes-11]